LASLRTLLFDDSSRASIVNRRGLGASKLAFADVGTGSCWFALDDIGTSSHWHLLAIAVVGTCWYHVVHWCLRALVMVYIGALVIACIDALGVR
jgi:hypothetical protein